MKATADFIRETGLPVFLRGLGVTAVTVKCRIVLEAQVKKWGCIDLVSASTAEFKKRKV